MPRLHSHEEKSLVTIEHFLGCAESAVSILYKPMKKQNIMQALTLANEKALSSQRPNNSLIQTKINIADLAQPRTCSIHVVTRPFSS